MPSLNELLYDIRRISEHREKLTNNKIDKMYKQLIKDIDGYLGGAYKKYADDDGRLFIEYLDRINQRANFLNEISNNAYHLSNDVRDMIDEYVDKTYERSYADMRKAFYKAEQNGRFADVVKDLKAQPDVLNASFNNNIDKLKLTPALNNYRNSIVYQINQTLTIGLMQGMRYEQMAKKITERIGVSRNKANNIVRTETHRNVESGFINCAKDLSSKISNKGLVYAVTWNTLADEKVRRGVANHVIMNGKTVKVGDRFTLSDGSTTEYPGGSGVASQDCNCRCFLEYNLLTAEEFARKSIDSGGNSDIIEEEQPKEYSEAFKELKYLIEQEGNIEYRPVQKLATQLTEEEIINKLGGGDMTGGSCASQAYAYIANKNGLDVTDYRGGESREFFSAGLNIWKINELPGVKSQIIEVKKEAFEAAKILTGLEKGKEFALSCGKHCAIVKNTDAGPMYLELQSSLSNGWEYFEDSENSVAGKLIKRFGARKTVKRWHDMIWKQKVALAEVDSFANNEEFREIMGYLNTATDKQLKGVAGHEK